MSVASHSEAALPGIFDARPGDIAQSPNTRQLVIDRAFRTLCLVFAAATVGLVAYVILGIAISAVPAVRQYGVQFLTGRVWDPNTQRYGIAAEIWGTLYTSLLALGIGTAFGLAAAIFLSEGYLGQAVFSLLRRAGLHLTPVWSRLPDQVENVLRNLIELLAAIPSVVYGLWGLFVVIPMIRPLCSWLHLKLGGSRSFRPT